MAIPLPRRHISVGEFEGMIAEGAFVEDARVELIAGEIVGMAAMGLAHMNAVNYLTDFLTGIAAVRSVAIVSVQNAISLPPDWMPQPDIALLRRAPYPATPGAADVFLLIEVADSTRLFDRNTKMPRYAAAGIAEAWLVDLVARRIERHTAPRPDGYATIVHALPGQSLTSAALPAFTLATDAIMRAADGIE